MENLDQMDGVDIAEDSLRRIYGQQVFCVDHRLYRKDFPQEEYDALTKSRRKSIHFLILSENLDWSRPWMRCFRETKGEISILYGIMSGK